ncbi:IPT/TIG domain-containing protein [Aridibaculum aurantiacum]|uniref:IPT/TIG domain-containing protein n=1 Tax=Aridibaculum aurantiacum TaxID=2810307 RepID=UPI001A977AE2|nr:IPT/TIG domain-containing protein [Aridibaculum aurantiacum]
MIKYINLRLLSLLCLLVVGVAACKKNNDVGSDAVVLLSFGPTGAMHGDTLRFIGNNLNRVTEITFTGNGATVAQSSFIQQTPELVLVRVPQQAEKGFVTLKTPQGDIVSKTQLNLQVESTVSSLTPQARPGENITINGNYLNWVTRVVFANDKVVDTFVSRTMTQLVVKVPEDAQTGPLTLFYSGTEPKQFITADTLRVTLPAFTTLTPNPVKHQTTLTINGTNLDLVRRIIFPGVSAHVTTFLSQSATQIQVRVPAATVKGKLQLVAASGVAVQSPVDLDVMLPAVTSLAPNPIDPGANLTITGTNLDLVTSVSFTGAPAAVTNFVSQSATQLVVTVPVGTLKGKLVLGVFNSTLTVETPQTLDLNGGLPPLANFNFPIYTDQLHNTFQNWSYTEVADFSSTSVVRQGTHSIRAVYGGNTYQGITFHATTSQSTAGYTRLEFSVFGDASMNGKKLQVITNGNYGGPAPQVTIVGGEWTTFSVTLASMGNPTSLDEIVLQAAGFAGTIHIDHVGLR